MRKVSAGEPRPLQDRPVEPGPFGLHLRELRFGEAGAGKRGVREIGAGQVRPVEIRVCEIHSLEVRSGQVGRLGLGMLVAEPVPRFGPSTEDVHEIRVGHGPSLYPEPAFSISNIPAFALRASARRAVASRRRPASPWLRGGGRKVRTWEKEPGTSTLSPERYRR